MSQIDYTQPAKQILVDLLNAKNNIALRVQDVEFSTPQVLINTALKTNTLINLSTTTGSGYFGSRDISYTRMDIGEILESKPLETQPITETTLVQFLPAINAAYGTFLKAEDIYDVAIPPYDPLHPDAVRTVSLVIQPTSYFYIGTFDLVFGIYNSAVPEVDGVTRTYYILIDGYPINRVKESLVALKVDGSVNTAFKFLKNISTIEAWTLSKAYQLANGQFVLEGNFSLTYIDGNGTLTPVTDRQMLLINEYGIVISDDITPRFIFGGDTTVFDAPNVAYKYFIDPDNLSRDSRLFRYTDDGVLDLSFVPAIDYKPEFIRVTPDNKIYTISGVFSGADPNNNNQLTDLIRIDRLLSTGVFDPAFNVVFIRSSRPSYAPPTVVDLCPIDTQGFYLAFAPSGGLDSSAPVPVINGKSLLSVDTLTQISYAWSPLARFEADGELDPSFKTTINGRRGQSLFEPAGSSNMLRKKKAVIAEGEKICFMTNRRNPVSGYEHRQPVQFNLAGNEVLLSGQNYQAQYKWTNLLDLISQSNGLFVGYGQMQTPLVTGNYGNAVSAVGRYKQNGEVDTLLWRSPGPSGTSNPVVISVFLKEHA